MGNRICYIFISLTILFSLSTDGYAAIRQDVIEKDSTNFVVLCFDSDQVRVDSLHRFNKRAIALLDSLFIGAHDMEFLSSLVVSTYVSPYDDAKLNVQLAAKRNESIKEFLQQRYPFLNVIQIQLRSGSGEDWLELGRLIAADSEMPDREDVLMLLEYHRDNIGKRKLLLQKMNGGIPYRYIVDRILPKLRRSEIEVTMRVPEADVKVIKPQGWLPIVTPSVNNPEQEQENNKLDRVADISDIEKKMERRTVLAVKNNLIYDLALAPNIEVEVPIGKRWSFNAEYKCPWWLNNSHEFCYQLLSGGLEGRYWLGNRQKRNRLTGHFLGLYAEGGVYDFQFGGDGYQGNYYGASGLTYGYAHQVARHLSLEFSLGVGYLTTEYRKYTPYEGDIVWTKSGRYNFFGPTKVKVSLVWLITTRR